MPGQRQQCVLQHRIPPEALCSGNQPEIELVFQTPHIRLQLRVISLRIIHQVSRMHLEKSGQRLPRRIRQVRTSPALNLGQITLAQLAARLSLLISRINSC